MLFEIAQDDEIIDHRSILTLELMNCDGIGRTVGIALAYEGLSCFSHLMSVMYVFDGLLKADCDEDAEDNDAEMDEEVAQCERTVVRRVDVDHSLKTPESGVSPGVARASRR